MRLRLVVYFYQEGVRELSQCGGWTRSSDLDDSWLSSRAYVRVDSYTGTLGIQILEDSLVIREYPCVSYT